jgi:hypothetical protein
MPVLEIPDVREIWRLIEGVMSLRLMMLPLSSHDVPLLPRVVSRCKSPDHSTKVTQQVPGNQAYPELTTIITASPK